MAVQIATPSTNIVDTAPKAGTPTNLTPATVTTVSADNVKVSGTSGNDVFTLTDLQKDSDQVITTGTGNDVFRFNGSEGARAGNTTEDVNGIIKFGGAASGAGPDNDQVFLGYQLSDYEYTLRSDGGIKIHYVGDDGSKDGAAVTFYGAESFTFRGFSDTSNTTFVTETFTYDQLVGLIMQQSGSSIG